MSQKKTPIKIQKKKVYDKYSSKKIRKTMLFPRPKLKSLFLKIKSFSKFTTLSFWISSSNFKQIKNVFNLIKYYEKIYKQVFQNIPFTIILVHNDNFNLYEDNFVYSMLPPK